ncbi:4'-phosphopantetheinyl transferase superfamily protein [Rufibacter sediminis]|uniref:Enterobactin synthase component D n=1 Tax=Rufibacter sediminis TaxID=2762756 RepID=A0ABR6VS10_9BACT|nr:4'-phosphopantetheinyl transferase family protein [Rufibacter sediminis]MBC3539950.1 4'-phosphopantetheinyl transferase superfamily protein [Rufibacter sediminis]
MPLHQLQQLSSTSLLGLWLVTETTDQLREELLARRPDHELPVFKAESRTREWLAARLLAYLLLEKLSAPDMYLHTQETGGPVCSDAAWHVSLTHSGEWVGAMVSGTHQVGIDLELKGEKAPRLAPRFLNEAETAASASDSDKIHVYWSAKETLYKVYRHKKLHFKENLLLEDFDRQAAGAFTGRVVTDTLEQRFTVQYEIHPAFVLTYVLAPR